MVVSYRQTCYAYPSGGGAFAVSLDNFGENAALTAAAALLVDYVMTVAVSVVAGVVGITSAAPSLHRYAVALSVGFTVVLMLANLRGVRESGRAFAIPTYTFVALTYLMFLIGAIKGSPGSCPTPPPPTNSCSAPPRSAGSSPCCSSCARSPPAAPR